MRYPARSCIGIFADDRCPVKPETFVPVIIPCNLFWLFRIEKHKFGYPFRLQRME